MYTNVDGFSSAAHGRYAVSREEGMKNYNELIWTMLGTVTLPLGDRWRWRGGGLDDRRRSSERLQWSRWSTEWRRQRWSSLGEVFTQRLWELNVVVLVTCLLCPPLDTTVQQTDRRLTTTRVQWYSWPAFCVRRWTRQYNRQTDVSLQRGYNGYGLLQLYVQVQLYSNQCQTGLSRHL